MTEQQISTALDELTAMVAAGQTAEAFDKFYHADLEKSDFLSGATHTGKAANEQANQTLVAKITAFRALTPLGRVVKGNRSFLVWWIDIDHADHGTVQLAQVAIQDWQDGKIIRERFVG